MLGYSFASFLQHARQWYDVPQSKPYIWIEKQLGYPHLLPISNIPPYMAQYYYHKLCKLCSVMKKI